VSTFTLSVSSAGGGDWGDIALVFRDAGGPGASASGTGTGAPSLSVTTTGDHSAVCLIVLDANAVSGTSRTWLTVNGFTPSAGNGLELGYTLVSGTYGIYIAYWPDAGLAGTKTVGLSAPTGMKYTAVATEILGSASAPSATASLPATLTVTAHPPWIGAQANLAAGFTLSGASLNYPIQQATLNTGVSLAAGPVLSLTTVLPVAVSQVADAAGWLFTSLVPLTYLQYLGGEGTTLEGTPGLFTAAITPASGYAFQLPIPPHDGRWVSPFVGPGQFFSTSLPAPTRTRLRQHGQRSMSAYAALGARRHE
jgi:hypothetical protein